jgi:hypothetical protein
MTVIEAIREVKDQKYSSKIIEEEKKNIDNNSTVVITVPTFALKFVSNNWCLLSYRQIFSNVH